MELIYENSYGAFYSVKDTTKTNIKLQMVVDNIGIFLSVNNIDHLLDIIKNSETPCNCEKCNGKKPNKIWTNGLLVDICLKINDDILEQMEDLIVGTKFLLNMDDILEKHKIK